MSKPAVTVTTTPIADALTLMTTRRIHYLPVLDAHGALAGMVNSDDALGTLPPGRAPGDTVGVVMSAQPCRSGPWCPSRTRRD